MNATSNTDNWYYNGGEFDPLEDFDAAEKVEAEVFVEKFKQDAPAGFVYNGTDEDNPFGSWTRKDDEFGGTEVMIHPVVGSDAVDYEYPDNFEMWVYAGEGMEIKSLPANWDLVDSEIKATIEAWSMPNPYTEEDSDV